GLLASLAGIGVVIQLSWDVNLQYGAKLLVNFLLYRVYYLVFFVLWNVRLNLAATSWYNDGKHFWKHYFTFNSTVSVLIVLAVMNWTKDVKKLFYTFTKSFNSLAFDPLFRAQEGLRWLGHTTAKKWPVYGIAALVNVLLGTGVILSYKHPKELSSFQ